jgi:tetratricopeptide (TPR) repeat protein
VAADRASLRDAETFLREGQTDKALELYRAHADRQFADGFYAQAGALFKKILKLRPDDEPALVRLGDIAASQGLVADAKAHYTTVATRRSERSDAAGAAEMSARLVAMETRIAMPLLLQELRDGHLEAARARMTSVLSCDPAARAAIVKLIDGLAADHAAAAALCAETAAEHAAGSGEAAVATTILQRFARRVPGRIQVLLRLVEIAGDAGLEGVVLEAQAGLADAYLAEGRAQEARVLAEDLVTRDRSDGRHVERLRRSLELLAVPDIEGLIADRLNAPGRDPLQFLEAALAPAVSDPTPSPMEEPVPAPDLDDIFAGLRAQAEADPLIDESEHYITLARSHIETGAAEDAIEALLHAVQSPKRRFRCAAMLAQLYRDIGDIPRAIEWCERAAEAPASSPEDGARVMYDLADLLETMGEHGRALAVFMEIEAGQPGFMDVTARIAQLSGDQVGG